MIMNRIKRLGCVVPTSPYSMQSRVASLIAFLLLALVPLRAEVRCPAIFGDHMVLQRDRAVTIWGDAAPNEAVAVEFGGQAVTTHATPDGHWRARLAAMPASAEGRTLTVRGTNTLSFSDVLVGEVWLCSGQSNMEKQLGPRRGQKPTDNYEEETRNANYPLLRLYQMPQHGKPQKGVRGLEWVACTPETVASTQFSAAGYFFGRELLRELNVPIGMIHSSFGGTQIEAWIPDAMFAAHASIQDLRHVEYKAWVKGVQATELYESMIVPLVPYTLRGFLWYQGESNAMQAEGAIYTEKMKALMDGWRAVWAQPDAPWYYVQLAPFDYSKWTTFPKLLTPEELPVFWEAQTRALEIPHTGMIVTTDLVANLHDIHPTNKRDVGLRLARLALADTYGRRDLVAHSPSFVALKEARDGTLELTFKDVGDGLKTRDGKPPSDFMIAGVDQRFVPAEARLAGDRVIVSAAEVKAPVAVRFAWSEVATPNLVNSAGLPAIPFRTDAWPVTLESPRPPAPPKDSEETAEKKVTAPAAPATVQ